MKTKEQLALIVAALTLLGCHILSKDKQTLKKLSQKETFELTAQRNLRSRQSQLVLTDSSDNDFTLMLWPKGKFTFSVVKGFEGEAEKILIKGKQVSQKVLTLKEETKQDSTLLKANYSSEQQSSTTVKKNKFNVGYNWAWLLLLPVLYLSYRLYKRFGVFVIR